MKIRVLAIHIQNYILPLFLLSFMFFLIVFPKTNLIAARDGILLWANNLVPTLLPFLIATELLTKTDTVRIFGKFFTKWMRPLFNVPGEAAFAFLMGMISGYPVGAKIITDFRKQDICTKEEAERMLAFCNNSGPLFIIATVRNLFLPRCSYWFFTTLYSYFSKFISWFNIRFF